MEEGGVGEVAACGGVDEKRSGRESGRGGVDGGV